MTALVSYIVSVKQQVNLVGVTVLDFKHTYGETGADTLCFNIQHFLKVVTLEVVESKIMYGLLGYKRKT